MVSIRGFVLKSFADFRFFYSYLRHRLFLVIVINIGVGVIDGFGLSMFLPLLQLVDGGDVNSSGLGNLEFVVDLLKRSGIPLTLVGILSFLTFFFLLKGFLVFCQGVYEARVQQFFVKSIRDQNIRNLAQIEYKKFVMADVGQIQNTLSGEVDRVSRALASFLLALQQVILVSVYVCFAVLVDAQFAGLVCFGGLATNFVFKRLNRETKATSRDVTAQNNAFQGLIIQFVANFRYLKATGSVVKYSTKLLDFVDRIAVANVTIGRLTSMLKGAREPLIVGVISIVIALQTAVFGSPLGPILISLLFFYRALTALMAMQTAWNYYLGNSGSLSNMTEFTESLKKSIEVSGVKSVSRIRCIEIRNGSFSYGQRQILYDINLTLHTNETVAFVGETGGGKTTLVSILSGLLPLDSGRFLVDGTDRIELNVTSFQQRVGYITQEPVVFNDTLYNNVTMWADETDENLRRYNYAIQRASLVDFEAGLREGRKAMLGHNGVNLSGGQKQRVAIAREFFKQGIDILILDEATSALDADTEQVIQESIESLRGRCMILIVAHRLSTIKNADKVVFLEHGRISLVGGFEELLECSPAFKRMARLQGL